MPTQFDVTAALLVTVAGAIASLLFSYFPGLRTWWATVQPDLQRGFMALLMLLVAIAVTAGSCLGFFQTNVVCTQAGFLQVAWLWLMAIMSNQSVFGLSPKTKDVREAKLKASLARLSMR